jgi:putative SOS response-associated peptidase YedK
MQIKKGRCLIPASHFFEFTGTKPPKSKGRFTKAGEDWFCFAGLWRPMPDAGGDAFTLPAALLEAARSLRPARSRLATTQRTQPNSSR